MFRDSVSTALLFQPESFSNETAVVLTFMITVSVGAAIAFMLGWHTYLICTAQVCVCVPILVPVRFVCAAVLGASPTLRLCLPDHNRILQEPDAREEGVLPWQSVGERVRPGPHTQLGGRVREIAVLVFLDVAFLAQAAHGRYALPHNVKP